MSVAELQKHTNTLPSAAELVARAKAMIPMLREKAESVENNGMVPHETIQAFVEAGFFKMLQPARCGGWEMPPEVYCRVLMELGRGCASSAWNMMILGIHQWEMGLMPEQAGEDVWGEDDKVLIASSYPPVGIVKKVEGGYHLEGRWPTSSGSDHGQWAFLGAMLKDENGISYDRCSFLVPREAYELLDDWKVFGLKGTGSKSCVVKGTFVPEHRVHSMVTYQPAGKPPTYRWPQPTVFFAGVSSVLVGFGQQAIDIYTEQMKVRTNTNGGQAAANSPYVRDRLGNAVVLVKSARARILQMFQEGEEILSKGIPLDRDMRAQYQCELAHVGRNVEQAVLLLYKATGARGLFLNNPMQRVLRDTLAAANHITQNADDTSGVLGGMMLGLEPPPFMFGLPPQ
jgi:3-hydroxy-9,10-secoandrosta-1,3,5(10)-triene-9,17-dione monooxygenase